MASSFLEAERLVPPENLMHYEGETIEEYAYRLLSQTTVGSGVSAENDGGSSAPTSANIGQIQTDVAKLQEDVKDLEAAQDDVVDLKERVTALEDYGLATGSIINPAGTSSTQPLPTTGLWRVTFSAVGGAIAGIWYTKTANAFTVHWTGDASALAIDWIAKRDKTS